MTIASRLEGYMCLDHRGSPGVPEDLMVKQGLPPKAGQKLFETKVFTCNHCEKQVYPNDSRGGTGRPRYECSDCNHYICDDCAAIRALGVKCYPFKAMIADMIELADKGKPSVAILTKVQDPRFAEPIGGSEYHQSILLP